MEEPARVSEGSRPQSGRPTGNTGEDDMPLITPAADAYHAIAAVTIPAQPPACRNHGLMPWATLKKPITSRISVTCSASVLEGSCRSTPLAGTD